MACIWKRRGMKSARDRENMTDPQKELPLDIRDAFFDELYEIARRDSNVIFLTADMGAQSLEKFKCKITRSIYQRRHR